MLVPRSERRARLSIDGISEKVESFDLPQRQSGLFPPLSCRNVTAMTGVSRAWPGIRNVLPLLRLSHDVALIPTHETIRVIITVRGFWGMSLIVKGWHCVLVGECTTGSSEDCSEVGGVHHSAITEVQHVMRYQFWCSFTFIRALFTLSVVSRASVDQMLQPSQQ